MDTDLLKNFCAVAKFESMTKAAEFRNISQSAVSKKLSSLESILGNVSLFHRYPSGLQLTEEGSLFLPVAEDVLDSLNNVRSALKTPSEATTGELKVLAMASFGLTWFSQHIRAFREENSKIDLTVSYNDLKSFAVASHNSGVFAGLATIEPRGDSSFIWKKLASFHIYPYAHSSYIAKHGMPKTFADLDKHKILNTTTDAMWNYYLDEKKLNWLLHVDRPENDPRAAEVTVDSSMALHALLQAGLGVGLLPKHMAEKSDLVELFQDTYDPSLHGQKYSVYLVYPAYLKNYERIKILRTFVEGKLRDSGNFIMENA